MQSAVESIVTSLGEFGVGLLIVLESVIPPIPSEVVLPLAGFYAQRGDLNLVLTWVAATTGSLLGALALYWLAAWLGWDRLQALSQKKWFFLVSASDLRRGEKAFDRYGWWVIGLGRCVPFIRSAVSLPAGLSRMGLLPFCVITTLGSGAWNALFIWLGYHLGPQWEQVATYVAPISKVVVVAVIIGVIILVVRRIQRSRARQSLAE